MPSSAGWRGPKTVSFGKQRWWVGSEQRPRRFRVSSGRSALLPLPSAAEPTDRLDRGGNRQINAAIHRVAVTRARYHPEPAATSRARPPKAKTRREANPLPQTPPRPPHLAAPPAAPPAHRHAGHPQPTTRDAAKEARSHRPEAGARTCATSPPAPRIVRDRATALEHQPRTAIQQSGGYFLGRGINRSSTSAKTDRPGHKVSVKASLAHRVVSTSARSRSRPLPGPRCSLGDQQHRGDAREAGEVRQARGAVVLLGHLSGTADAVRRQQKRSCR
jgi:hypothetical protein